MYFDEALKQLRESPDLFYIRRSKWDIGVCLGLNFERRSLCFRCSEGWNELGPIDFLSLDEISTKDWEVIYSEDSEASNRVHNRWEESSA